MDQQNEKRPVLTPEEIARLEAEAVAAIQRGETPKGPEAAKQPEDAAQPEAAAPDDFVPYVDDVVEPVKPAAEAAPDVDEDENYIPGKWETWAKNLPEEKWRLIQIVGGAALGLASLALLFIGGEELVTYRTIVAALLVLLLPRYLERVLRRELGIARRAMIVAMLVGLVIGFLIIGARSGFNFRKTE